jgi:AraC-like DNA-binding protein
MRKNIIETDITKAKNWTNCLSLDDDLLMFDDLTNAPFPTDTRRLNFVLICLCTQGQVNFTLDTKELTLKANDLMVVSEKHILDHYQATPDFNGLCLMISIPFYSEIVKNVSDISALFLYAHYHPVFPCPEHNQLVFKEYFRVIQSRIKNVGNTYRNHLVRTLMLAMLYEMSDFIDHFQERTTSRFNRSDIVFTQFLKLVEKHCKQERRVSWYAQQLNITPKYLSEMVKTTSKRTPNQWIDYYVVLEMRALLKDSTKSIKEITEEMNFPNQSFLGKFFKEHTGMSPSAYRKS